MRPDAGKAEQDQVDRDDEVQQARDDEDQDPRHQRDQRLNQNDIECHGRLPSLAPENAWAGCEFNRRAPTGTKPDANALAESTTDAKEPTVNDPKGDLKNDAPAQPKAGAEKKPMSEQATHQGGGGVNKDHKPHGAGPLPKGRS
jgi:hypothetical protein